MPTESQTIETAFIKAIPRKSLMFLLYIQNCDTEFLPRLSSSLSKGVGVKHLVIFSPKVWISFCILTVDRFIKYNQVLIIPKYKISANYN